MKKKIILALIIVVSIIFGILIGSGLNKEEASFEEEIPKQIKQENTLSMMVEQTIGGGNYEKETRTSWPTDGYKFNATLSKCENGGELGWDDTNKVVTMTGNMSDRCFVYFDKVTREIDVNFVGSTSTTLKINVTHKDGSLSTDYDTYYYSTDGGETYVSSSSNTYSVDYTSGTISSLSVYASSNSYNSPNTYTKKIFNGGTVQVFSYYCSDSVCGYYGKVEGTTDPQYRFNSTLQYDNMNGYLFNNSILDLSGKSIEGSGNNSYYMRFVGTTTMTGAYFVNWNNLYIDNAGDNLTFESSALSNVSNVYFSSSDGSIILSDLRLTTNFTFNGSNSSLVFNGGVFYNKLLVFNGSNTTLNFKNYAIGYYNGTILFNLNDNSNITFEGCSIGYSTIIFKVTGDSSFASKSIKGFSDLSTDAINFLKSLVSDSTTKEEATLSFDFNGFTFTLDEAKTYISSLS